MSHYGPPGGNGPYGQQPEGWPGQPQQGQPPYPGQSDPFSGRPEPYQGQPHTGGFGSAPAEQDPFGGRMPDRMGGQPSGDQFGGPPGDQFGAPFGGPGPGGPGMGGPAMGGPGPGGPFDQPPQAPDSPPQWDGGHAPPKKSKTPLVIILIVVLVLVGGGGAGWYFLLGPGKSDKTTTADDKNKQSGDKGTKESSGQSPAQAAKKGDCVVHQGSNSVKPVDCSDPQSFKIVDRFDGTTDKKKCPGQQTNYIYVYNDLKKNSQDFVLCLAAQKSGK